MSVSRSLRSSSFEETPPFQASKWLKTQVLLDDQEMRLFFEELKIGGLYLISEVCSAGQEEIKVEFFLQKYQAYIDALKNGSSLPDSEYRASFSGVITLTTEALRAIPVDHTRNLVRVVRPVIQLQPHRMDYSLPDKKFHPMVYGQESISWGLQFSYPQIYKDPATKQILAVKETPEFPNTALFKQVQRWLRHHTVPTPFILEGQRINIPVRLGKGCFSWVNNHPDLKRKKLSIFQERLS